MSKYGMLIWDPPAVHQRGHLGFLHRGFLHLGNFQRGKPGKPG